MPGFAQNGTYLTGDAMRLEHGRLEDLIYFCVSCAGLSGAVTLFLEKS
jgi:hypothetical protein